MNDLASRGQHPAARAPSWRAERRLPRIPGAGGRPVSADRASARRRRRWAADDYVDGVIAGDRSVLAQAITLVESSLARDVELAQEVLNRLLPRTGRAKRVGITGVPGVGKSTLIESLGTHLVESGQRIAVLAIDPTSTRSHGSILGDKTRMDRLCQMPAAFIRPSPSGESVGGVARRTRETMLLCEAAGFETVLVETVGVGQTEVSLRSMVDFFLLLLLPGAGDELQGIKKGIIEMVDLIAINKADGDNRLRAELARRDQDTALHYLQPGTPGWKTEVVLCSGLTGEGVRELWERVERFYTQLLPAGAISRRRQEQSLAWMEALVQDELLRRFYDDNRVVRMAPELRKAVLRGEITPVRASAKLLDAQLLQRNTKNP